MIEYAEGEERVCLCGHGRLMHVDDTEQCVSEDCGCKEFEEKEEDGL